MIEWIGYLAAFLTTVCYIPQALHVIVRRDTKAISLPAYVTLFVGLSLWFTYGILRVDWPIILCNGISLPLLGIILVMKLRLG
jgi:MtN3 and saliva related transmembrane protein